MDQKETAPRAGRAAARAACAGGSGFLGRKRSMYEGGIRVPGIARWPGRIEPGTTSDAPVVGTDLFPTVLGISAGKVPADRVIDGADILPVLTGKAAVVHRKAP